MRIARGALLLLLILICVDVMAQQSLTQRSSADEKSPMTSRAKPKPKRPTAEYWMQACEKFTLDIAGEDWRLTTFDKALLNARLCSVWWQADQVRARTWCAGAADTVSHKPQQESEEDRKSRLTAAREVLRVVSPLDAALGKQVQDAIELAMRDAGDGGRGREYLAMSLGAAASEAEDPEQALRLISESLRAGGAFHTITAVFKLAQRDPARGDQAFSELLGFVRQNRNFSFLNDLLREVFSPSRDASAKWQHATVETVREMAAVVPESELDRRYRCRLLGTIITSGSNIPPTSATAMRSALADCETATSRQQSDAPASELKTTDDYLRAAMGTTDLQTRVVLKTSAAMRADTRDHEYDRALDILDALTEEELRARPGMIPRLRLDIATRGGMYALEHDKDIAVALHIVGRNPDNLRGSVELAVASQAGSKGLRGATDVMQAATRDLRRYRTDDPHDYVTLANLSLPQKGDGALTMTRDMVRRLAEWEPLDPKALKPMERYFPPLEQSVLPLPFGSEIADLDLDALAAIGKSLRSTKLRASFDLGVLQHLTKRYVEERPQKPQIKPAVAGQ